MSLPQVAGTYVIRVRATRAIYIGQSINVRKRWQDHRKLLAKGAHHNKALQEAWTTFGDEGLSAELHVACPGGLSALETQRWLVRAERAAIAEFRAKGVVTNEAEPEIVATKEAVEVYQKEKTKRNKATDKATREQRKAIKNKIDHLEQEISPSRSKYRALVAEIRTRQEVLKRSSGWRRFIFAPPTDVPVETQKAELEKVVSDAQSLYQTISPVEQKIQTLQREHRQLYHQFSKVQQQALARFYSRWPFISRGPPRITE